MDATTDPAPDIPDRNVWGTPLADRGDSGEPMVPLPGRNDDQQGEWPDNRIRSGGGIVADTKRVMICTEDGEEMVDVYVR